jgi:hypothetical protein
MSSRIKFLGALAFEDKDSIKYGGQIFVPYDIFS